MKHLKYSASSVSRWTRCHGSISVLAVEDKPSTKYSSEGTNFHEECRQALSFGFALDDEVQGYLDLVNEIKASLGDKVVLHIEKQFHLADPTDIGGSPDLVMYGPETLHIVDIKSGYMEIDPHENEQLMTYVLAVISAVGLAPKAVYLHIYQPGRDPAHTVAEVHPVRLLAHLNTMLTHREAIEKGDTAFAPGAHCQFCNRAACPVMAKRLDDLVQTDTDLSKLEKRSSEDLLKLLQHQSQITGIFKDAHALLLHRAESGEVIPGHKLVKKYGQSRYIKGTGAEMVAFSTGLDPSTVVEPKLVGITKIRTLIKKMYKGDERDVYTAAFEGLLERPETGSKLVSTSSEGSLALTESFDDLVD